MTPSAQMSARASIARVERICSGDMYRGDPMTMLELVESRSDGVLDVESPS